MQYNISQCKTELNAFDDNRNDTGMWNYSRDSNFRVENLRDKSAYALVFRKKEVPLPTVRETLKLRV